MANVTEKIAVSQEKSYEMSQGSWTVTFRIEVSLFTETGPTNVAF